MAAVIDEKAGADGPSTTAVRDLLSGIVEIAKRYAPPEAAGGATQPSTPRRRSNAAGSRQAAAVTSPQPGQAPSREDALRTLSEIADFFRRTEPHSPLSYTLR